MKLCRVCGRDMGRRKGDRCCGYALDLDHEMTVERWRERYGTLPYQEGLLYPYFRLSRVKER